MKKKTLSNLIFYGALVAIVSGFFIYSAVVKSGSLVTETNDDFLLNNVLDRKSGLVVSEVPAVIEFYTPGCPACKLIDPFFKDLSNDFKGKVYFYKINAAQYRNAASLFALKGVPSVVFAKPGEKISALTVTTGFKTKIRLKKHVKEMLVD